MWFNDASLVNEKRHFNFFLAVLENMIVTIEFYNCEYFVEVFVYCVLNIE
jgi:hypothetical protein